LHFGLGCGPRRLKWENGDVTVIEVKWADANLHRFAKQIDELKTKFPMVLPRIINQVGRRSRTQVIRALTKQTGLNRKVIVSAVNNGLKEAVENRAHRIYSYEMVTRGGNIRLKYLKPRETLAGVVAKPFGQATLYPGAFMRGGKFPDRKSVPSFNGHVMFRNRAGSFGRGRHYTFARSGVFIPIEMGQGATRDAFLRTAGPLLKQRVEAAIAKLL
jgi:hypothetical protein